MSHYESFHSPVAGLGNGDLLIGMRCRMPAEPHESGGRWTVMAATWRPTGLWVGVMSGSGEYREMAATEPIYYPKTE